MRSTRDTAPIRAEDVLAVFRQVYLDLRPEARASARQEVDAIAARCESARVEVRS